MDLEKSSPISRPSSPPPSRSLVTISKSGSILGSPFDSTSIPLSEDLAVYPYLQSSPSGRSVHGSVSTSMHVPSGHENSIPEKNGSFLGENPKTSSNLRSSESAPVESSSPVNHRSGSCGLMYVLDFPMMLQWVNPARDTEESPNL